MEVIHLVFSGEGLRVSSVFRTPTGQLRAQHYACGLRTRSSVYSPAAGKEARPTEETAPQCSVTL